MNTLRIMRYHIALYDYIYGICITTFKYSQNLLIQLNVLTIFNTEIKTKYITGSRIPSTNAYVLIPTLLFS